MIPMADLLEKEGIIKFERFEVWHDEKNADRMRSFRKVAFEACEGALGVPLFIDEERRSALCGEKPFDEFKKWIQSSKK